MPGIITTATQSSPGTETTASPAPAALSVQKVTYRYPRTAKDVLHQVSADFDAGRVHVIAGRSGSGKTTLLSLLAGLDLPTGGQVLARDQDAATVDRDRYRARDVGVVFQAFNLLTSATAVENIILAMNIAGSKVKDKSRHALELLDRLGIDAETARRPVLKLSGGQQQRVAIARAVVNNPSVLIADEPTGNLDAQTEAEILEVFTRIAHEEGRCVVVVNHSQHVARIADQVVRIDKGRVTRADKGRGTARR